MNAAVVLPVVADCVIAVASVGVAVGPASGFARSYVDRLERAGSGEAAGDCPTTEQDEQDERASALEVPIRSRGLLRALPQGLLAALLCATTLAWGLAHGAVLDTALALPVVALLGVASSVDAVCHRLPDRLLGPAALWLLTVMVVFTIGNMLGIAPMSEQSGRLGRAVVCALAVGAVVFVMWLIPASGMGLGDVKLCALLGLWLGYNAVEFAITGVVLGFVLAGFAAIGLMLTRRAGRKDMIAFGPYLAAGGWLAWLLAVV
ncbi:prepilin peptidase [Actinomyces qiguomingii]|uniref:prepilin peptidase n=1 Tax=Actinomyces qiguomingii TaxID=2057800 RepID=UPI001E65085D|nr:A24 family peptidase [Actinomyces qiguomingii]